MLRVVHSTYHVRQSSDDFRREIWNVKRILACLSMFTLNASGFSQTILLLNFRKSISRKFLESHRKVCMYILNMYVCCCFSKYVEVSKISQKCLHFMEISYVSLESSIYEQNCLSFLNSAVIFLGWSDTAEIMMSVLNDCRKQ